jgi:hypothetical protein
MVGASRSAVQALCASVVGIPLSTGTLQQLADRVSAAIVPHDTLMGQVARPAPVNDMDETACLVHGDRHWLWGMAHPGGASLQIPLHRSKAALAQLMANWQGILVRDGSSVEPSWQGLRQSGLAPRLRTAKGLAEHMDAGIARGGGRLHAEVQRLCQMGPARPTVGQWRAW